MKRPTKIEAVIKNYGIMWRRDHILWGRGRSKGALEGRSSARKVDFREISASMSCMTSSATEFMLAKQVRDTRASSRGCAATLAIISRIDGITLAGLGSWR